MKLKLRVLICLSSLAIGCGFIGAIPVNASVESFVGWSVQNWNTVPGNAFGSWVLSADNTSVTQTLNSNPSVLLNGADKTNYSMQGYFRVDTANDDDYIGFVFGYQDSKNFYLFDWKQAYQAGSDGVISQAGFSVKKFSAPPANNLTNADFSGTANTQNVTILANKYGNEFGWTDFKTYGFYLCFTSGTFQIVITDGPTILWDVIINDPTFSSGQFGLFNNSQPSTVYFNLEEGVATCGNSFPIANAGPNLAVFSENSVGTIILGLVSDSDGDSLAYRWLEGLNELVGWQTAGPEGEADLNLNTLAPFSIGEHVLTLEVDDGKALSRDEMILTVSNSAPHPAPAGGGTYELFAPVILSGQVADFDGDLLAYQWLNGNLQISSGQIQSIYGGDPVSLAEVSTAFNSVGNKLITLQVSDGVNAPVSKSINVNIIDSTAPTLALIPNKTILWPPNHQMVGITIQANASDNSGNPVTLTASVTSNEPIDGLGDGDTAPDWTQPVINQQTGEVSLQLRAERSGSGTGRVYTITITAIDQSDNTSTADVKIVVPHDNRKK